MKLSEFVRADSQEGTFTPTLQEGKHMNIQFRLETSHEDDFLLIGHIVLAKRIGMENEQFVADGLNLCTGEAATDAVEYYTKGDDAPPSSSSSSSETESQAGDESKTTSSGTSTIPNTGDSNYAVYIAAIILMSACSLLLIASRKKSK